jgi:hypothetical protein
MNMSDSKVTISKAVSIEDVPAEIRTMVDKVQKELCYTIPDIMKTVQMKVFSNNGDEFFQTVALLDYLRAELSKADASLEECVEILSGYKKIMMENLPSDEEPETNNETHRESLVESPEEEADE